MWFFTPGNHFSLNGCYSVTSQPCLLACLLIPRSRVLEKLTGSQQVKKIPTFMEPEGSLPHLQVPATCPYPEPARTRPWPPHPTSWRSILILSSHLCLGLPRGLFPSSFSTKSLYTPPLSLTRTTCPAHIILLDLIARTILGGGGYRSLSSSLCSFLHSSVTTLQIIEIIQGYSKWLSGF